VVPIARKVTEEVRAEMLSPQYGHPAFSERAKGYGPCRECLRTFREGEEERILFTYDPFDGLSELPLPGPVFIHKEPCIPHTGNDLPTDLLGLPLLFEAFGEASELLDRSRMDRKAWKKQVTAYLSEPLVRYVNLRNEEAGCFVARIERK